MSVKVMVKLLNLPKISGGLTNLIDVRKKKIIFCIQKQKNMF